MKYYLSLVFLLSGMYLHAQTNFVRDTGKVGIGTTTPSALLHVNGGNIKLSDPIGYPWGMSINLSNPTTPWAREFSITKGATGKMAVFGAYGDGASLNYAYIGGNATTDAVHLSPWMVFRPSGNIGIGTFDPPTAFAVKGGITIFSAVAAPTGRPPVDSGTITGEIRGTSPGWYKGDDGFLRVSAGGGTSANTKSFIDLSGYTPDHPDRFQNITLGTSGKERMRIASNGNIGIGTVSPTAKLAVNGDIKAQRVKVTMNAADWPDYVFGASYQLPGLLELEDYIRQHRHLPGVPSAEEVKKEGSVDLGSMNEILLRKVEELTLYMIELKKENTALKGRLDSIEAKR